jgi:hypothetical protein
MPRRSTNPGAARVVVSTSAQRLNIQEGDHSVVDALVGFLGRRFGGQLGATP